MQPQFRFSFFSIFPEEKRGIAYGLYHRVVGVTILPRQSDCRLAMGCGKSRRPFFLGAGLAFLAMVGIMGMVGE